MKLRNLWILLMPGIMQAQTNITDDITSNTVWDISGSPYIIMNSISVQDGVTLSIDPGVEVKFDGGYSIAVLGEISAIGTVQDSIIFTSNRPNPNPLDWDRILIQGKSSDNSELKYCKIKFARVGVSFENTASKISSSLIERCHDAGITAVEGSPIIENNIVRDTRHSGSGLSTGIHITSGSPLISGNNIYNNDTGITVSNSAATIMRNLIYLNAFRGIECGGSSTTIIINNTIDNNGFNGGNNINVDSGSPIIKNNIVTNCSGDAGIRATSGANPINTYNNVWNNRINYWSHGGTSEPGTGSISEDPLFVDPSNGDYHVQSNSPCIDAGDPDSPLDPDGTRADMGAIPFHEGTHVTDDITENTVWDISGSPYVILNTVSVNQGATLTIESGVTIKFDSSTSLIIKGTITAQGEESNRIIFTSNKSTPNIGDWGSVRIDTSSGNSSLIEYANFS
ncbi:MAG: right-handed parallel beta-helix repeat-containing protein, partial [bacterium]